MSSSRIKCNTTHWCSSVLVGKKQNGSWDGTPWYDECYKSSIKIMQGLEGTKLEERETRKDPPTKLIRVKFDDIETSVWISEIFID